MNCSLCGTTPPKRVIQAQQRLLYECGRCRLISAGPADKLSHHELRERYLLHENSIENKGYCDFLNQAIRLAKPHLTPGSKGLDFGCGPGPTLSQLVEAEGFNMTDYDPIFFDNVLSPPYDFIFSTECFEHFEEPKKDIARVVGLLREGGILALMTELWDDSKDFKKWRYASEPTHVSFYAKETMDYICQTFGLEALEDDGKRVFIFTRPSVKEQQPNLQLL